MARSLDQDNFYSMPCAYLGNCVIVNNVKEEMPETVQEVADLQKACETIGFDVTVYTDQSLEGMNKIKKEFLSNNFHKDRNCFMLCILAHGNADNIYTKNEKVNEGEKWVWKNYKRAWNIQDIQDELDEVPSLLGKPKLLLIDSCRWGKDNIARPVTNSRSSSDLTEYTKEVVARGRDFLVFFVTVNGYYSYRHSGFFETVGRYLEENYKTKDLETIYLMVKRELGKKTQKSKSGDLMICPEVKSTLNKQLDFSKYKKSTSKQKLAQPSSQRESGSMFDSHKEHKRLEEAYMKILDTPVFENILRVATAPLDKN